MIQEAYVSFETAKLLKEKWFDAVCISLYLVDGTYSLIVNEPKNYNEEHISRPTYQMVLAWLRAQGVHIDIVTSFDLNGKDHYSYTIYKNGKLIRKEYTSFDWCYEEATEEAIKYVFENLI